MTASLFQSTFAQESARDVLSQENSYFGNTKEAKNLYEEKVSNIKETAKVTLPTLPLITFIKDFMGRIHDIIPDYFYFILYGSVFATALLQFYLARIMHHPHPIMSVGYFVWLALLVFHYSMNADIHGLSVFSIICLIAPVWQLFQMAKLSFFKSILTHIVLGFILYAFTVSGSIFSQNIVFIVWTLYIIGIYIALFGYITHAFKISFFYILLGLLPFMGIPTLFLLCIRTQQIAHNFSVKFVNIVLKLLAQGRSKLEIRNYAIASKVRMSFFEHNFLMAFRYFEKGIYHVSPTLYKLSRRITLGLLGSFTLLSLASFLVTSNVIMDYFSEWQQNRNKGIFLDLIAKDNDLLVEQYLVNETHSLDIDCPETWENCNPLYIAVTNNSYNVLPILLKYGAPINAQDPNGKTIIQIADEIASKDIVRILKTAQFQSRSTGVKR